MEIRSEFVADHDTKFGSYKLSFNTLVLAWLLANLTISVTKFSFKGRILYKNVCVFEDASCLLHNKTPFAWSRVPQTILLRVTLGELTLHLFLIKNSANRLHEVINSSQVHETRDN